MPPQLRGLPKDDLDTRYSKTLAYLLRHGAEKHALKMRRDGYVRVVDILCQPNLISLSFPHLHHLVKSNAKQRFALIYAYDPTPSKDTPELPLIPVEPVPEVPEWDPTVTQDGPSSTAACVSSSMSPQPEWFIRAAQGHSLKTIAADQLLEEVTQANEESLKRVGEMVHGTTWNNWEAIRDGGLSRMTRQHIHLTTSRYNSTSGPRQRSDLFIYLALPSLLSPSPPAGLFLPGSEEEAKAKKPIQVFVSSNNVVLTPGNEQGRIPSWLFHTVVRARKEFTEVKPEGQQDDKDPAAQVLDVAVGGGVESASPEGAGKAVKPARRRGKAGGQRQVREWDEVIWENGKVVDPPRVEEARQR